MHYALLLTVNQLLVWQIQRTILEIINIRLDNV